MKLHSASRAEVKSVLLGTLACDALMIPVLALLPGPFAPVPILLGAAGGTAVAAGSFAGLCLTVQRAVSAESERTRKALLQASYHARLALQALWVIFCASSPRVHTLAGAAPLLFPSLVIFLRRRRTAGKEKPHAG